MCYANGLSQTTVLHQQAAITGQLDTALLDEEEWKQYQEAFAKNPDPVHAGAPSAPSQCPS